MKTRAKQVEHPGEPIIVIEDDVLFRRSILRLLEEHGYKPSAYESFRQFQDIATIPQEGCIILDLHLPGTNGLEIQRQLSAIAPSLSIIFLTAFGRIDVSVRAMKNGAVDFLEKPVDSEVLLRTIDQAIERTRTLSRDRVDLSELRRRFERLSEREREVFTRITSGLLNKQAAAELKITEKTVKFHRAHIMRKMEVGSFAELAKMAARLGLNDRRVNQANPLGADGSRNDAS